MPAPIRVSVRQMEILVEFAESNPNVALGCFPGGPEAVQVSQEVWNSVALHLNSVAVGTTKSPDQWRRYWIEFIAKTKGKAQRRCSRRNASATGGGPNKLVALNELEKRVLAVLSPVAVEGLPGVRLPINIPSVDETVAPVDSEIAAPDPVISCPSTSTNISQSPNSILEPLIDEEASASSHSSPASSPKGDETSSPSQTFDLPPFTSTQPALPPSTDTQPTLPPSTENRLLGQQPQVRSRDDKLVQPSTPPARRSKPQKRFHRYKRPPRWAYEMESRSIAAVERRATAMEALVELTREIRSDLNSYVSRLG